MLVNLNGTFLHDVLEWGQNIPGPIKVGNLDYKANVAASQEEKEEYKDTCR